MRQVVMILHAHDVCDANCFVELFRRDVAETNMVDQALALQVRKRLERRFDRACSRTVNAEHEAQVDDVEGVEAEVTQVVMYGARQLLGREGRGPRSLLAASGPDLGDDAP